MHLFIHLHKVDMKFYCLHQAWTWVYILMWLLNGHDIIFSESCNCCHVSYLCICCLRISSLTRLSHWAFNFELRGSAFPAIAIGGDEKCLWDKNKRLAICGDFCASPNVEGAVLSGIRAASKILEKSSNLWWVCSCLPMLSRKFKLHSSILMFLDEHQFFLADFLW